MRTSTAQFVLIVEFMERNGDLSKPTDGPHGRAENHRLWTELTRLLNGEATGDTKSLDKWRKVWSDLKNNTKKKYSKIYRAAQKTGGGPPCPLKLTDLEERVMSIIGARAATGIEEIPEVGLEEAIPETWVNDDSPSIFFINEQLGLSVPAVHSAANINITEEWNMPGTSAQPPVFPPVVPVQTAEVDSGATVADSPPETVYSLVPAIVSAPPASLPRPVPPPPPPPLPPPPRPRARLSPSPLPLTPRRRRRRAGQAQASPALRRTRTQTQSDQARQAFVNANCDWLEFQQEQAREKIRLRERELDVRERELEARKRELEGQDGWLGEFRRLVTLAGVIVEQLFKQK